MGSARVDEFEYLGLRLQWYICHCIARGKGLCLVFPADCLMLVRRGQ